MAPKGGVSRAGGTELRGKCSPLPGVVAGGDLHGRHVHGAGPGDGCVPGHHGPADRHRRLHDLR